MFGDGGRDESPDDDVGRAIRKIPGHGNKAQEKPRDSTVHKVSP